jgi:hypothetical protein
MKLVACAVSAKLMRHLLWFRLHFGRTSTPSANDALNFAIGAGVVCCFERCSALHVVEIREYRVVGEIVCKQVILKFGHNLRFGEGFCTTERESASITCNEMSHGSEDIQVQAGLCGEIDQLLLALLGEP